MNKAADGQSGPKGTCVNEGLLGLLAAFFDLISVGLMAEIIFLRPFKNSAIF